MTDIENFITEDWYPGFVPPYTSLPYVVEPYRNFTEADKSRFWFLDFHWPSGLTPLGMIWNEDGYSWGTQLAAEQLPLPRGRGMAQRVAGTHTYAAIIPVEHTGEIAARERRMRAYLPGFVEGFDETWRQRCAEIEAGWRKLSSRDVSTLSDSDLAAMLRDARSYYRRLFAIHFEMMYPLIVNYLDFRDLCGQLGIDPATIAKFLQGYDTKITQTDRALTDLAGSARAGGLEMTFAITPAHQLAVALNKSDTGRLWLRRLNSFLDIYGYRTAGTADVALPSWIEDPTSVFTAVRDILRLEHRHDFCAAQAAAVEEREAAIDGTRGSLTGRQQQLFDAGLANVQRANFPRWQDDHNFYIDLRASLPIRWVALELARRVGTDHYDDTMFLFWPELEALADRRRSYGSMRCVVEARRQYFDYWREKRAHMPKILGSLPESIDDPLLIEIYGFSHDYLNVLRTKPDAGRVSTLRGMPVARGSGRGPARVVREPADIKSIMSGDILVCESTSVSWTLAFNRIAGCVCDSGGTLSHAAIVGREYGVPTVTACGVATSIINDGDDIHVDGDTGVVTILARRT